MEANNTGVNLLEAFDVLFDAAKKVIDGVSEFVHEVMQITTDVVLSYAQKAVDWFNSLNHDDQERLLYLLQTISSQSDRNTNAT